MEKHGLHDIDQLAVWVNRREYLLSLRDKGGYDYEQNAYIFTSSHREELKVLTKKINDFHKSTDFKYA
jgi:hypothetical protein